MLDKAYIEAPNPPIEEQYHSKNLLERAQERSKEFAELIEQSPVLGEMFERTGTVATLLTQNSGATLEIPDYRLHEIHPYLGVDFLRSYVKPFIQEPNRKADRPTKGLHAFEDLEIYLGEIKRDDPQRYNKVVEWTINKHGWKSTANSNPAEIENNTAADLVIKTMVYNTFVMEAIANAYDKDLPINNDVLFDYVAELTNVEEVLYSRTKNEYYERLGSLETVLGQARLKAADLKEDLEAASELVLGGEQGDLLGNITAETFRTRNAFRNHITNIAVGVSPEDPLTNSAYEQLNDEEVAKLPISMRRMVGLKQYNVAHGEFDPLAHSLRVCHKLDTEFEDAGTEKGQHKLEAMQVASYLHDIGKGYDSFNTNHAYISYSEAISIVEGLGYKANSGIGRTALQLIKYHDAIGFYQKGVSTLDELVHSLVPPTNSELDTDDMYDLFKRVFVADVTSWPELTIPNRKLSGRALADHFVTTYENEAEGGILAELERRKQSVIQLKQRQSVELDATVPVDKIMSEDFTGFLKAGFGSDYFEDDEFNINKLIVEKLDYFKETVGLPSLEDFINHPTTPIKGLMSLLNSDERAQAAGVESLDFINYVEHNKNLLMAQMIEHYRKNCPEDAASYEHLQILFITLEALKNNPIQDIKYFHGTSTVALDSILATGYIASAANLKERDIPRVSGEFDKHSSKSGGDADESYYQTTVSITESPSIGAVYGDIHAQEDGYTTTPALLLRNIQKNYRELLGEQAELQENIMIKRGYLEEMTDSDTMTYKELRRKSNEIYGNIIEAQATLRETTLLEAKIKRLTTCRTVYDKLTKMPEYEQRQLWEAGSVVLGFSNDEYATEDVKNGHFAEKRSEKDIPTAELQLITAPIHRLRGLNTSSITANTLVMPVESFRMIAALMEMSTPNSYNSYDYEHNMARMIYNTKAVAALRGGIDY